MAVATSTGTVTVNAAFLQEIKEVNRDLWRLLEAVRRLCCHDHTIRHRRRKVVTLLGHLRDQLAMHFALEEAYGYFDDPVFVAPHLSQRAETLRSQHQSLYLAVSQLASLSERLLYGERLRHVCHQVSRRFINFYDQLQEHESLENELILEAYDDDIGVGD